MRYNELIVEKGITTPAYTNFTDKELSKLIPYRDIILNTTPKIYRGMKIAKTSFILGDGSLMDRKSKNTKNFYTLIIDNDPSWDAYPKRSKSFICTTDIDYAGSYGQKFYVFPLEHQPIGICPENDFWNSFYKERYSYYTPANINSYIDKLAELLPLKKISQNNFNDFKNDIDKISSLIKEYKTINDTSIEPVIDQLERAGLNLEKYDYDLYKSYVEYLNPEKNNFSISYDVDEIPDDREVWLSGKVLFIKTKDLKAIKNFLIEVK